MPEKNKSLLKLLGPDRADEFQKLWRSFEKKFPRFSPWGTPYDLKETINSQTTLEDHIERKIVKGSHYGNAPT